MKVKEMVLGAAATNTYLVFDEESRKGFVIDPADKPDEISREIQRQDFLPEAILLTHGHFDHIMAADALRVKYQIPVYAGSNETELLKDPDANLTGSWMGSPYMLVPDISLSDGRECTIAGFLIRTLFTPGHTAGSVCFYMPEEKVLFSGDTLFEQSYGRTDLITGSFAQLRDSIRNVLFLLPEEVLVYPGHGALTDIGWEKLHNPIIAG